MSVSVDLVSAFTTPGAPEATGGLPLAGALANELAGGAAAGGATVGAGDFALLLGMLGAPQGEASTGTGTDTPTATPESEGNAEQTASSDALAAALAGCFQTTLGLAPDAAPAPAPDGEAIAASPAPPVDDATAAPGAPVATTGQPGTVLEVLAASVDGADEVPTGDTAASGTTGTAPSAEQAPPVAVAEHGESVRPIGNRPRAGTSPQSGKTANAVPVVDAKAHASTDTVETVKSATGVDPVSSAVKVVEGRGAGENGSHARATTDRTTPAVEPAEGVDANAATQAGEEGEPGRRGSDGGVVKAETPTLAQQTADETPTARRTSGGPDPSAPGPLPPHLNRESAPAVAAPATPEPVRDVERFLRLQELRPAPIADRGEMRLHVASELGPIEVRVAVRDDGVHANLYAQHDQARQTLEAQRSTLASALERSNLRLEGFTVGLGQHQQGGQGEPGREGGLPSWSMGGAGPLAATDEVTYEPVAPLRGLSLRA